MTKFVAIPPRGCRASLTPGKEYSILRFKDGGFFEIIDDDGFPLQFCKEKNCAHLNGRDWTILDKESDEYHFESKGECSWPANNTGFKYPCRQKIEGVAKGIAFVYLAALAVVFVVAVGYALLSIVKPLLPW